MQADLNDEGKPEVVPEDNVDSEPSEVLKQLQGEIVENAEERSIEEGQGQEAAADDNNEKEAADEDDNEEEDPDAKVLAETIDQLGGRKITSLRK